MSFGQMSLLTVADNWWYKIANNKKCEIKWESQVCSGSHREQRPSISVTLASRTKFRWNPIKFFPNFFSCRLFKSIERTAIKWKEKRVCVRVSEQWRELSSLVSYLRFHILNLIGRKWFCRSKKDGPSKVDRHWWLTEIISFLAFDVFWIDANAFGRCSLFWLHHRLVTVIIN